ncbi:MAG: DUF5714 domain-containing protein [Promethearchaeia archaeon]
MDKSEFEECKNYNYYDEFMENALKFDGLTMDDYQEFMQKVPPILLKREEKDPILMFENIIEFLRDKWAASEELPFHGPWHHGLVPGVIIAALRNNGYNFTDKDVKEAFSRGLKIPAGGCGFCGTCGGGTGLGIAISIVNEATPFHNKERSSAFKAALKANERIGKLGGPRCCRLSAYTALDQAIKLLTDEEYDIPQQKVIGRCEVHNLNSQCHGNRCPYFPKNR